MTPTGRRASPTTSPGLFGGDAGEPPWITQSGIQFATKPSGTALIPVEVKTRCVNTPGLAEWRSLSYQQPPFRGLWLPQVAA